MLASMEATSQAIYLIYYMHPGDIDTKMHTFWSKGRGTMKLSENHQITIIATSYGSESLPSPFSLLYDIKYNHVFKI